MIKHDTISVVIKRAGKEFLLIKRGNRPEKGYWAPPGGHVDKGETPYEAAVREAKEEAGGVVVTRKKPVFIFVHDAELFHRHRCHVFFGKAAGKVRAGGDASAAKWFTLKQMEKVNLTHPARIIFNKLYGE